MRRVFFTIYSNPVAQGRPRFAKIGNFVKAYDPKESRAWKDTVKAQAIDHMKDFGGPKMLDGPLSIRVRFFFSRPKSHYGSGKNATLLKASAPRYHTSKPDLDNLVKGVKDALKGLCYKDDSQICLTHADKQYDDQPRVMVEITKMEDQCSIKLC